MQNENINPVFGQPQKYVWKITETKAHTKINNSVKMKGFWNDLRYAKKLAET